MQNLRVVSDNAAERAAISASSTAGSNLASYLGTEPKSELWRATGKVERLDFVWGAPEPVSAVGLAYCNWSPTALMRVRASGEGAATNLVRYSAAFDNAAWTKTGVTPTANYGAAPDGTNTAQRLVFSGAGQSVSQGTTLGVGVSCSGSVWIKGIDGQTITVSSGGVDQLFVLSSAWQRLKAAGKTSTSTSFAITTNGGATARDIQAWGAQLETGAVCTSYIPTTGAAAARAAGYIDSWQSYDYDSGWIFACPAVLKPLRRLTAAQSASAYSLGGGAFARHWLASTVNALRVVVEVNDANNLQGFVEATNAIIGPTWQAKKNVDYGVEATPLDFSKSDRGASGDLLTARSFRAKKLRFTLSKMDPEDANTFWEVLRTVGASYPIWVSVSPDDNDDPMFEAIHQIYGKFITTPSMSRPSFRIATASPEIESI